MGRTGICYDNALAESFNGALKVERVHRTVYATRRKAHEDIARYIELRYNRKRLHSAIGYRTPQEAMDEYLEMKATAYDNAQIRGLKCQAPPPPGGAGC